MTDTKPQDRGQETITVSGPRAQFVRAALQTFAEGIGAGLVFCPTSITAYAQYVSAIHLLDVADTHSLKIHVGADSAWVRFPFCTTDSAGIDFEYVIMTHDVSDKARFAYQSHNTTCLAMTPAADDLCVADYDPRDRTHGAEFEAYDRGPGE